MRIRLAVLSVLLVAAAALAAWHAQSRIPRSIVLASGGLEGAHHLDAASYARILERDGITVVERTTAGSGENAALLNDPASGVDVAFLQGGVASPEKRDNLEMLAAIRYEPVWVFYRSPETLRRLEDLRYKRIGIGNPGNGAHVIAEPMLEASNVTRSNSTLVSIPGREGLRALQDGTLDAAIMVGDAHAPMIWQALHDDRLRLMSMEDAQAYARRLSFLSVVTLPAGTVDMRYRRIPETDVTLVATKAMLAVRKDFPSALVAPIFDAARELHGRQGYFEAAQEFPNTAHVDLPVSPEAERHSRFGATLLHRHLPFWLATLVEKLIVVVLPVVVIVVPLVNLLPRILLWRMRSRIYRWYGQLKLLERDVEMRRGDPPVDAWLAELARIEHAAMRIRTTASMASEAYTLREHINLVRGSVLERAQQQEVASAALP